MKKIKSGLVIFAISVATLLIYWFLYEGPMERERVYELVFERDIQLIPDSIKDRIDEIQIKKYYEATGEDTIIRLKKFDWINKYARARYTDWRNLCAPDYSMTAILNTMDTIIIGDLICASDGRFDDFVTHMGIYMTIESGIIEIAKNMGTVEIHKHTIATDSVLNTHRQ